MSICMCGENGRVYAEYAYMLHTGSSSDKVDIWLADWSNEKLMGSSVQPAFG